jgi:hypothetical protein
MWKTFKSWWYWNISSKYDGIDIFMFTGFPLMIVLFIFIVIGLHNEKKELSAECEKNGGVLVSTHKQYYCIDKKVLLK